MDKCTLCGDSARTRKYFFQKQPLCDMHYAEYLEFLFNEMKAEVTAESAGSAFEHYRLTLEPRPMTAKERAERAKREKEKREKEREYEPKSHDRTPVRMGM